MVNKTLDLKLEILIQKESNLNLKIFVSVSNHNIKRKRRGDNSQVLELGQGLLMKRTSCSFTGMWSYVHRVG